MSGKSRIAAGVVLASGALVSAVVASAPVTSPAGAASQVQLPGTGPVIVRGSSDLGPAAAATPVSLTVVLPWRHRAALGQRLAALYQPGNPEYHHFLTPAAFDAAYAPRRATVAAVRSWASGSGLTVAPVPANRALVRVAGPVSAVDQAFATSIHRFRAPSGTIYLSNARPAAVPAALAGDVSAVLGLSSLGQVRPAPLVHPASSGSGPAAVSSPSTSAAGSSPAASGFAYPTSYDPQQLWALYDAPSAQTGQGQTLAILAEGDLAQPQADLRTFEQTFNLPQVPWTTVQVGAASSDTSGSDEWDLDTQWSTAMAPGVSSLLVYDTTSLSDSDVLAEMNRFVTDDQAKQASFSAGECEVLADTDGFVTSGDQVLEQGAAQGQTLFASSGDTGSFCPALVGENGVPAGLPDVNYPASSPWAVGVGGTTVLGLPQPATEIAWYAGGGGQSLLEPEPSYQASVGGSNLGLRRGVPDVSLDADPESGYDVIVNGTEEVVGGTSASSPSWLGIWTRAQGAHGGTLGFADPTIYAEPASSFHDIVIGANGFYAATPGYDYVTGRGTPDATAFVGAA